MSCQDCWNRGSESVWEGLRWIYALYMLLKIREGEEFWKKKKRSQKLSGGR